MSLERDLADLLSSVRGHSLTTAGSMADRVSEGVRDAGIVEAVSDVGAVVKSQGADNAAALASVAAAMGIASDRICAELRESNSFLKSIESASLNPIETEARELYRRGVHALSRGWAEESVDALKLALEKNPLTPEVHASIAVAYVLLGDLSSAEPALQKAVRYSTPDSPELAVGSTLLLSNVFERSGRVKDACALLEASAEEYPNCPEVAFSLARLTDGRQRLREALALAPELGVLALSMPGWPGDVSAVAEAAVPAFTVARQIRDGLEQFGNSFDKPVATKWTHNFGAPTKSNLLASAESFDYLRRNIQDVWKIAMWGKDQSSAEVVRWRADMVEYFTSLTENLRRLRPWKQPGDTVDPAKSTRRKERTVYMRPPSPLVLPVGPDEDPTIEVIRIPSEIIQLVDLGVTDKAAERLVELYPWMDNSGAKHVLEWRNQF